jgi:hypothetical protein
MEIFRGLHTFAELDQRLNVFQGKRIEILSVHLFYPTLWNAEENDIQ